MGFTSWEGDVDFSDGRCQGSCVDRYVVGALDSSFESGVQSLDCGGYSLQLSDSQLYTTTDDNPVRLKTTLIGASRIFGQSAIGCTQGCNNERGS